MLAIDSANDFVSCSSAKNRGHFQPRISQVTAKCEQGTHWPLVLVEYPSEREQGNLPIDMTSIFLSEPSFLESKGEDNLWVGVAYATKEYPQPIHFWDVIRKYAALSENQLLQPTGNAVSWGGLFTAH